MWNFPRFFFDGFPKSSETCILFTYLYETVVNVNSNKNLFSVVTISSTFHSQSPILVKYCWGV